MQTWKEFYDNITKERWDGIHDEIPLSDLYHIQLTLNKDQIRLKIKQRIQEDAWMVIGVMIPEYQLDGTEPWGFTLVDPITAIKLDLHTKYQWFVYDISKQLTYPTVLKNAAEPMRDFLHWLTEMA